MGIFYIICHFIAVTAWINYLTVYKKISFDNRYYYFAGLGGTLWLGSVLCTVLGFLFSTLLSYKLLIGLVFFNPMYFLLMTVKNLVNKKLIAVFFISLISAPILYMFLTDWGIILSGLLSGSLSYLWFRKN